MPYADTFGRTYTAEPWENDRYDALADAEAEIEKYKHLYYTQLSANSALTAQIKRLESELYAPEAS